MSTVKDFSGKVVIVTGSSSGIGEGTAILFAKLGAHVVVTGRNRDNVKRVADICLSVSPKGLKALEVIADITSDEDNRNLIDSTVKKFGRIDVLVNNAGALWRTNTSDDKYMEIFDRTMRIDLRAVVYTTHLAMPYLETTKGSVVNISSVAGIKPYAPATAYCMAKSALDMFTKCLAVELGPKGIRVNGINSGYVETNIQQRAGLSGETMNQFRDDCANNAPLRINGLSVDIANSVVFLASDEASFITGTNMVVDGGALCV